MPALTLLMQSVAAPAHCLAMARPPASAAGWALPGIAMPICTPDGMRLAGGDPAPPEHGEPGFCPVAQSLPTAWTPDPPRLPLPRWQAAAATPRFAGPAAPRPARRAAAFAARAPPAAA